MLNEEFESFVKGLDTITEDSTDTLLKTVLHRLVVNLKANSATVWQVKEHSNAIRLKHRARYGRGGGSSVIIDKDRTGVLAWTAQNRKSLWIEGVRNTGHGELVSNHLTNEKIPVETLLSPAADSEAPDQEPDLDPTTNAAIVVPAFARNQLRGILMIEAAAREFSSADVDSLWNVAKPIANLLWKLDSFEQNSQQTKEAIAAFEMSIEMSETPLNPYRTGFVARPFDEEFTESAELVKKIFEARKVRVIEYEHPFSGDVVIAEIYRQISAAHFGVVDITGLRPNVLLELGMIMGLNKPFVMLKSADDDGEMPFDIASYHFFRYIVDKKVLMFFDPAKPAEQSADTVLETFLNERMMNIPAFVNAKEWT